MVSVILVVISISDDGVFMQTSDKKYYENNFRMLITQTFCSLKEMKKHCLETPNSVIYEIV